MTVDEADIKADMHRLIQAWFEHPVEIRPSAFILGERLATIAARAEGRKMPRAFPLLVSKERLAEQIASDPDLDCDVVGPALSSHQGKSP